MQNTGSHESLKGHAFVIVQDHRAGVLGGSYLGLWAADLVEVHTYSDEVGIEAEVRYSHYTAGGRAVSEVRIDLEVAEWEHAPDDSEVTVGACRRQYAGEGGKVGEGAQVAAMAGSWVESSNEWRCRRAKQEGIKAPGK